MMTKRIRNTKISISEWDYFKLGDVLDIQGGSQPPKSKFLYKPANEYVQLLQIRDFGEKGVPTYVPVKSVSKFCIEDDILIARYGASLGRILTGKKGAYNVALAKVIDEKGLFDKRFIFYLLQTSIFQHPLQLLSRSAQNGFSKSEISHIELPTPPISVQRQIVSKIEELFSELDKSIEQLKTAQQQLKVYRQAVLKWAFEGRLTNEGIKDGKLPIGWKWTKLNDIGKWFGGGTPSKQKKEFWDNGNVLWVSPKDMKAQVINDTIDKITIESLSQSSAKMIKKGSILFVVRSGIIRRTLPIAVAGKDLTTNQDLQSLTVENVSPKYVYWYCVANEQQIREVCAKDGTTVDNLEVPKLKNYAICICSIGEQHRIVQEVESRLSVADQMEQTLTNGLQQAEVLKQSILKNLFEGKIVKN